MTSDIATRRVPKQKRSRQRYDQLLDTARQLIAEKGNDAVSMREIAEASDIPIGSVYQYFPDKNALLWTLISHHFDMIEQKNQARLATVSTIAELNDAMLALFDLFATQCESDPFFSRIWASVQANAVLMELDRSINPPIAEIYTAKLHELAPLIDREHIRRRCLMLATLSSAALQLAFDSEDTEAILDEFRELMRVQLARSADTN
ncbi:MAG: TetR/AcrR family transcriptional regulator [Pseudomonadales bacterium]|nr:TetR/AcrR family transcriptional regulator [Pseudomonadales bacterium]